MMNENKYTVLMSVYKKEKKEYLEKSIQSMLNQTIPPDEFVIVKDGPLTIDLDTVIDSFCAKYPSLFKILENKMNLGLGPALAKGINASRNELIERMDSDDISVVNRCERQLEIFKRNPGIEMIGSFEAEFIGDIDNVISIHRVPENNDEIKKFMRRRCAILHPTVMYKKSAVLKSGNYRSVPLYEDYDLFARMVLEYNVQSYNIQDNLYYIRTSEDFFKRRGGVGYAKTVLKFKWGQYKKGYMSLADFCISGLGQAIVCIIPNSMRKMVYVRFLRR
ncbi:MAG: glycosyltransferase [Lachnospiraceae bacterium]